MKAIIFDFNRTLFDPEKKKLISGATALLDACLGRGLKLGLLSIDAPERRKFIQQIFFYFDDILLVREKKQKQYSEMASRLGIPPSDVLIIGDRIQEEIRIGNRLGMTMLWLRRGKYSPEVPRSKEEQPDFTMESLEEIRTFLYQEMEEK